MSHFTTHPAVHPEDYVGYDTRTLRERFVIEDLFEPGAVHWHYCAEDRLLLAGVCPDAPVTLEVPEALGSEPLLERREMGVVNLGGPGEITIGGERYLMEPNDGLYIGKGAGEITLSGRDAKFYCTFAPAHHTHPVRHIRFEQAEPVKLGSKEACNERTIYFYIAPGVTPSCQLMMGITVLESGSVWNTMPCHRHLRRMEVYLYVRLPEDQVIVHLMGRPGETRNVMLRNEQAVISPPWSIHCAAGTQNYAFLWCMAGENQDFKDMESVEITELY
jgi:4-deoxy-L-threo-5-hexosulose-uronate ketol-isomerase